MGDAIRVGEHQVRCGVCLLRYSGLVQWDHSTLDYSATKENHFENDLRKIDPTYGRIISWINFGAGAEFLAKGVCLLNNIEVRNSKRKCIPAYPQNTSEQDTVFDWARKFRTNEYHAGKTCTDDFGTLGKLYNCSLPRLCDKADASSDERNLLSSTYKLLGRTIRNRDAHGYVEDVRQAHFYLLGQLFVPCFNILLCWVPAHIRAVLSEGQAQ